MVMCLNLLGKCKYGHSQAAGTFLLLHSVRYSGTKQRAYLSYLSPRLLTRSVVSGGRTNHLIKNTSGREQRERKREKKKKKTSSHLLLFKTVSVVMGRGECAAARLERATHRAHHLLFSQRIWVTSLSPLESHWLFHPELSGRFGDGAESQT